jgi:1,4-dihydroxy-2-naphthoate octaprenyltransferase
MSRLFYYFFLILKQSLKPSSIAYPIPFLQLLVFTQSHGNPIDLLTMLLFTHTFYPAVNIWNHINDVAEDTLQGKDNIFAKNKQIKILGFLTVLTLFIIATITVSLFTKDSLVWLFYIVCFIISLAYSDNYILKKHRLKNHYLTESLSFAIAFPMFTLILWCFVSPLTLKAYALSTCMLFYTLFGLFLKDLKDIEGDSKAGLKTLGVVFKPKTLLQLVIFSEILFYISVIVFYILGIFNKTALITLLSLPLLLKGWSHLRKIDWKLAQKPITTLIIAHIFSIILFTVSGLLP